jgi:FkbM family methyltransferase
MITSLIRGLVFSYKYDLKFSDQLNYFYIFNEIFVHKDYGAVLPCDGGCVFDVGGNIGLYTLYVGMGRKNLDIHVFEPVPTLFANLEHNVRSVMKDNAVHANNVGLSNVATEATINFFPKASGLTTLKDDIDSKSDISIRWRTRNALFPQFNSFLMKLLVKQHLVAKKETIKLIRMSEYIDAHHIESIDMVKIDVEGHEFEILQGIEPRHFDCIKAFIIEVENFRDGYQEKITTLLKSQGYTLSITGAHEPWSLVVATRV